MSAGRGRNGRSLSKWNVEDNKRQCSGRSKVAVKGVTAKMIKGPVHGNLKCLSLAPGMGHSSARSQACSHTMN
jgi:hypothetical protein